MNVITLDKAERLIRAAQLKAAEIGVAASIVVLDAGGHLKAFSRMDGSWLGSIDVAMRKAKTSVLFEMETQIVWEIGNPQAQAHGIELTNEGLATFAGGIPLKDAGGLLGAIGVSGGLVAQDYDVARAGAAALEGLSTIDQDKLLRSS
jgi:uncharacterized protein GlcG (DUF336 family)